MAFRNWHKHIFSKVQRLPEHVSGVGCEQAGVQFIYFSALLLLSYSIISLHIYPLTKGQALVENHFLSHYNNSTFILRIKNVRRCICDGLKHNVYQQHQLDQWPGYAATSI